MKTNSDEKQQDNILELKIQNSKEIKNSNISLIKLHLLIASTVSSH